jgi:hypothetical protein
MNCFSRDGDLLRFPIDICNRNRPARDQVDSGHELGKERRQKFPVPAEEVNHHGANSKIEQVVGRRFSALNEQGEDGNLEYVRNDCQDHGGAKARTCRDFDGVLFHVSLPISWWCLIRLFYGANAVAGT